MGDVLSEVLLFAAEVSVSADGVCFCSWRL